jgi:hypothetical protein
LTRGTFADSLSISVSVSSDEEWSAEETLSAVGDRAPSNSDCKLVSRTGPSQQGLPCAQRSGLTKVEPYPESPGVRSDCKRATHVGELKA